ncbi:hypothetical protein DFH27DRAFT_545136 [Peziza echinospora]|nr:hypothetical protein DFH27DRAFT_545136 [Peziza echinospora]
MFMLSCHTLLDLSRSIFSFGSMYTFFWLCSFFTFYLSFWSLLFFRYISIGISPEYYYNQIYRPFSYTYVFPNIHFLFLFFLCHEISIG